MRQGRRDGRGHGAKSDAVREQVIVALLSEKSIKQAAAKAGVDERTVRAWLAEDAAFRAQYDAARRSTFDAAMNRIHTLVGKAVDTLEDLLTLKDAPSVRLGAARTIAEIGLHQRDAEDILKKLNAIETAQKGGQR